MPGPAVANEAGGALAVSGGAAAPMGVARALDRMLSGGERKSIEWPVCWQGARG